MTPTRKDVEPTTSATDELRRLLDERGVKHTDPTEWLTYWHDTNEHVWSASEMSTGLLSVSTAGVGCLTPTQAIAATLGAGTCQLKRASWDDGTCTWGCICSACDAHLEHETGIGYNYCPICGAKVVTV